MKNKKLVKRFIKNNKELVGIFVVLFIFPIVIGLIYALPLPQIVAVDSGDLIAYYGTVFGITGSFLIYRYELNKKSKERKNELKPDFVVDVKRNNEEDLFLIEITNCSQQAIRYLYFYDEFVSAVIKNKYSFRTMFNKTIEEANSIELDYNITLDSEILDKDGFPKYVRLFCDDAEGNSWDCYYYKVKDCDKNHYYPRDIEII